MTADERGRRSFRWALAGILFPCAAPFVSWGCVLAARREDVGSWRSSLIALAVIDTLLMIPLAIVAHRAIEASQRTTYLSGPVEILSPAASGPHIGILADDPPSPGGVRIKQVVPDSPAEQGGLKAGDRIVAVDGRSVTSPDGLREEIRTGAPGKPLTFHIRRGDLQLDARITPEAETTGLFQPLPRDVSRGFLRLGALGATGYALGVVLLAGLCLMARLRHVGTSPGVRSLAILVLGVAGSYAAMFALQRKGDLSFGSLLITLFAAFGAMLVTGLLALRRTDSAAGAMEAGTELRARVLPTLGTGLLLTVAGYARVAILLAGDAGHSDRTRESFSGLHASGIPWKPAIALLVLLVVVLGPITEEVIFRGILLPWLTSWMTPRSAIVLSAVVFASLHLFYGLAVLVIFVYGLVLGWMRLQTGRLRAGILFHGLINAIACVVIFAF